MNRRRRVAAFANGPHDERRPPPHITCGEYTGDVRPVVRAGRHGTRTRALDSERCEESIVRWSCKAHREQHEAGVDRALAANAGDQRRPTVSGNAGLDLHHAETSQRATLADEFGGGHAPVAFTTLVVRVRRPDFHWPHGPRCRGRAPVRWLRQQFELLHAQRTLPVARPRAVGSGIPAADDDDVLSARGDLGGRIEHVACEAAILLHEIWHREMHTAQATTRRVEVARVVGAARQQDCIELAAQDVDSDVNADVHRMTEVYPFGRELLDPPVEHALLELEFRNTVPQQTAGAVVLFQHRDGVTEAAELLRRSESSRPRAYHRDASPGLAARRTRRNPSFGETTIRNGLLDVANGDRLLDDAKDACRFAGRRTEPAGEFGEIVGCMQRIARLSPAATEHEVVPLGNDVAHRAPGVALAEWHATIHAPGTL